MGRRLFYGWIVVAVTAVVVVIVSVVRSGPAASHLSKSDSGSEPGLPTQAAEAGA